MVPSTRDTFHIATGDNSSKTSSTSAPAAAAFDHRGAEAAPVPAFAESTIEEQAKDLETLRRQEEKLNEDEDVVTAETKSTPVSVKTDRSVKQLADYNSAGTTHSYVPSRPKRESKRPNFFGQCVPVSGNLAVIPNATVTSTDTDTATFSEECHAEQDFESSRIPFLSSVEKEPRDIEAEIEIVQENVNALSISDEAETRVELLMQTLNEDEQEIVETAIHGSGHDDEIVAQAGTDSVQRASMQTLKPGIWLNDEIIHYFYLLLAKRDEDLCIIDPSRKRSHFFKSFFITKLLNEGNASCGGKYEYRNVKRWSKKVPGKDIFNLDKILFPINIGKMHWICAAIFMKKKRIEIFDSMGLNGNKYLDALFNYIQDEHLDKKKTPLPNADSWKLVPTQLDTPRQANGHDCGVFTCMFADFLSHDAALEFNQVHIDQCRELIALSIMRGKAIM